MLHIFAKRCETEPYRSSPKAACVIEKMGGHGRTLGEYLRRMDHSACSSRTGVVLLVALSYFFGIRTAYGEQEPKKDILRMAPARVDQYGDPLPPNALVRLGTVRFHNPDRIRHLTFSPDGKYLASCGEDGFAQLWEIPGGRPVCQLGGRELEVSSIAFSPNGKVLAAGCLDGIVRLWEVPSGKELRRLLDDEPSPISAVAFAPDGTYLAVGLQQGPILFIEARTGKRLNMLRGHFQCTSSIAFSADGQRMVSAGADDCIRVWRTDTGREIRMIAGGGFWIFGNVAIFPDGKVLATANTAAIELWDSSTGIRIRRCEKVLYEGRVLPLPVAFSPNGKLLAVGGAGICDVATGKRLFFLKGQAIGHKAVAFSPDGKLLAAAGLAFTLCLYDATTGHEIYPWVGHRHSIPTLTFSGDGRILASGEFEGKIICLWDPRTGKEIRRFGCGQYWLEGIAFSVDSRILASQDIDSQIRLWDPTTGKEIPHRWNRDSEVQAAAFAPDGKILALDRPKGILCLRDPETGQAIRRLEPRYRWLHRKIAVSPNGKLLASGPLEDGTVNVWDMATGRNLHTFHGHQGIVWSIAFSPDSQTLASGGADKTVAFWDLAKGTLRGRCWENPQTPGCMAFSPDGRTLATGGGEEGSIRLWEVATMQERHCFQGHLGGVSCIAFSPDGYTMASAAGPEILVWDVTLSSATGFSRTAPLSTAEIDKLWADLADVDAVSAYKAICAMVRVPGQTVPFLRHRIPPACEPDLQQINRLIPQLDDEEFKIRERAERELEELGEWAEPRLRETLAGHPSVEVRRRAERLLAKLEGPITRPEPLRAVRVVEVLEHLGSAEARALLTTLARGAPQARLTREAQHAVERLNRLTPR